MEAVIEIGDRPLETRANDGEQKSPLIIETISLRGFRNLSDVDLAPSPRFNVIAGDNGQGKTNILEAIYLGGTTRSFRTTKLAEVVGHDKTLATSKLVVREGPSEHDIAREQVVGLQGGARSVKVDGKRPASLAAYAIKTPVVVFHPGEVALSQGPSGERRRLLDRAGLYAAPGSLADADAYARAIRERQRALETRGAMARDLDQWEALAVRHGLSIMGVRRRASEALLTAAERAFRRIAAPDLTLTGAFAPSAPEDEAAYLKALSESRAVDMRRKSASIGPHRDELALFINGHAVRGTASQGQHRALVLALKAAEIEVIGDARGARPILLLDDVSSELDRERTRALMAFLRDLEGQVFLTTTRPELIVLGDAEGLSFGDETRRDWTVREGAIVTAVNT